MLFYYVEFSGLGLLVLWSIGILGFDSGGFFCFCVCFLEGIWCVIFGMFCFLVELGIFCKMCGCKVRFGVFGNIGSKYGIVEWNYNLICFFFVIFFVVGVFFVIYFGGKR